MNPRVVWWEIRRRAGGLRCSKKHLTDGFGITLCGMRVFAPQSGDDLSQVTCRKCKEILQKREEESA